MGSLEFFLWQICLCWYRYLVAGRQSRTSRSMVIGWQTLGLRPGKSWYVFCDGVGGTCRGGRHDMKNKVFLRVDNDKMKAVRRLLSDTR